MAQDFSIYSEVSDGIVRYTVTGNGDKIIANQLTELADIHNGPCSPKLILADVRQLVLDMSFSDILTAVSTIACPQLNMYSRVAVLCGAPDCLQSDHYSFMALVGYFLGMTVKVFVDENAAVAWLLNKK